MSALNRAAAIITRADRNVETSIDHLPWNLGPILGADVSLAQVPCVAARTRLRQWQLVSLVAAGDGRLRLNGSVSGKLRHFERWCANCGIIIYQAQKKTRSIQAAHKGRLFSFLGTRIGYRLVSLGLFLTSRMMVSI